jgi:hypothetical protein
MLVHLVKGAVAVAAAAGVLPGALCAQDSSASPKASPPLATALAPSPVPLYPVLPTPVLPVRQLPAGVGFSGYLSARQTRRNDSTTFVVNRARITVMGAPLPYLAFRLQGDLSTAGRVAGDSTVPSSALTDAYVQLTVPRGGRSGIAERFAPALVVGQFKTPLSLEYLTSFSLLKTANRAQVVDRLATKRDVGALAQVGVGPWVTVAGAVTDGEGPNATRNPDNQELAVGRLTLRPVPWLAVAGKWAGQGPDHLWGYDARLVRGAATVEGEALHRTGRVPGAAAPATGPAYAAGGGYVLAAYRVLPWLEPVAKWERFREERAAQAGGTPISETWLTFGATARAPDDRVRFQVNWVEKRAHSVARDANELVAQLIAIY